MLIKLYEDNIDNRKLRQIVEALKSGGVIIYPTDTVYGMGCDIYNKKAVEKVCRFKGINLDKANFSFICHDMSHMSDYTKPISNNIFRYMKDKLPGPYTFILNANNNIPKHSKKMNKKTVGIRIPDNNIIRSIVQELGNPIMSTSIYDEDEILEYTTDPELIYEKHSNIADIVIDGGYGLNVPSTVLDCTSGEVEILREGVGEV